MYNESNKNLITKQEYPHRLRRLVDLIKINPKHVKAYNNLGLAYAAMERNNEAEAILKKAIQMRPDFEMSYGNLAILYFQQGKYDQAAEYYKKAKKLGFIDPEFSRKIGPYLTK